MEFHDILHGHIKFRDGFALTNFIQRLIESPEINRLRNMRQMNFDVPLIQELGRSRRLPHTIGVVHIARLLAERTAMTPEKTMALVAAAMLHDAAIPPYGHLVESEFKSRIPDFRHENRVKELILGTGNKKENRFIEIIPGKHLEVPEILRQYNINPDDVISLISPTEGMRSPISADIDIDNIDNVHRMAVMLGWRDAYDNLTDMLRSAVLSQSGQLAFPEGSTRNILQWLDYRQRIYTLIIAHPECIPYNALQTDLVRNAIEEKIIEPDDWFLSEPEFEERLRSSSINSTRSLATQLISGCEYRLVDYIWTKGFKSERKLNNKQIAQHYCKELQTRDDFGYFVWNERGLISREIQIEGHKWRGTTVGQTSTSCMIALVKKTTGRPRWTKSDSLEWRKKAMSEFSNIFSTSEMEVDYPETYTGNFNSSRSDLFLHGCI